MEVISLLVCVFFFVVFMYSINFYFPKPGDILIDLVVSCVVNTVTIRVEMAHFFLKGRVGTNFVRVGLGQQLSALIVPGYYVECYI